MTPENRIRTRRALENAAALIESHPETGHFHEQVGEDTEEGLNEYVKACQRAARLIKTLSSNGE